MLNSHTAIKISSRERCEEQFSYLCKRVMGFWDFKVPLTLDYAAWADTATKQQRGLYWIWMETLAKHFSVNIQFTKDDMHDLMRHNHLGYEDKLIGKTQITQQLKSTSPNVMGKTDMSEYMLKIDAWATDHGVPLPRPEENEYAQYRKGRGDTQ